MENQQIHILLVENDPFDVKLILEFISHLNGNSPSFKISNVRNLEDAKKSLCTSQKYDVVVSDLFLPDSQGLETLMKLESVSLSVPIIILSGESDESYALQAIHYGAQDYLVKNRMTENLFLWTILHAIERNKLRSKLEEVTKELRDTNEKLDRLSLLDPLTEVLNRRGVQQALSRETEWAKASQSTLLALIFDLDNFKQINDSVGHAIGDMILKDVARKIRNSLRVTDYVSRIGGDEFLVLLPNTKPIEGMRLAQKLRLVIAGAHGSSMNADIKITASFGLILVTDEIISTEELVAKAHLSLLESKNKGKNRVSFGADRETAAKDHQSISDILEALRNGEKYLVVKQPIVNLDNGVQMGYEFLSRVNIEGFEMPDDFFKLCSENNILTVVDYHCFKNCMKKGSLLPAHMQKHLNLFPSTILDIPDEILKVIQQHKDKGSYCVEISEQQIIGDAFYLVEPINSMKKEGVLIAIDDVGFGRSCLESLIILEPDIVKIDKRWVNGISKDPSRRHSLNRLLKVTQALGAEVVAEGIESQEDLDLLKSLGVHFGQGYLLGRPA